MTEKMTLEQFRNLPKNKRPQAKRGVMNKTEIEYEKHLSLLKTAGEITWFKFEGIKFKLAPKTFYAPDFAVINNLGELELHEVKGHWEDDARVKIKVAAEMFPFRFIALKKRGVDWIAEEF